MKDESRRMCGRVSSLEVPDCEPKNSSGSDVAMRMQNHAAPLVTLARCFSIRSIERKG